MNTHKITTPISKQEVEIKEWITGREAEYLDELTYESMSLKADIGKLRGFNPEDGLNVDNFDFKKLITEADHRKVEVFIVSVNGSVENILNTVLDMPEQDYQFVLNAIDEQRKKK